MPDIPSNLGVTNYGSQTQTEELNNAEYQVTTKDEAVKTKSGDHFIIKYEKLTSYQLESGDPTKQMPSTPQVSVIKTCKEWNTHTFWGGLMHGLDDVGNFMAKVGGYALEGVGYVNEGINDVGCFLNSQKGLLNMAAGAAMTAGPYGAAAAGAMKAVEFGVQFAPLLKQYTGTDWVKGGQDIVKWADQNPDSPPAEFVGKTFQSVPDSGMSPSQQGSVNQMVGKAKSQTGPGPALPPNASGGASDPASEGTGSSPTDPYSSMLNPLLNLFKQQLEKAGADTSKAQAAVQGGKDAKNAKGVQALPDGSFSVNGQVMNFSQLLMLVGCQDLQAQNDNFANMYSKTEQNVQSLTKLNSMLSLVNKYKGEKSPSISQADSSTLQTEAKNLGVQIPNGFSFSSPSQDDLNTLEQNISSKISTNSSENQMEMMKLNQAAQDRTQVLQGLQQLMQQANQAAQAASRA